MSTGGNILSVNWPKEIEQVSSVRLANRDHKSLINMNHWCSHRPSLITPTSCGCWERGDFHFTAVDSTTGGASHIAWRLASGVYRKRRLRMNPPRSGAPGGRAMSSTAEGAQYAAVLTLSLDPSGPWHPANVPSQPLSSRIHAVARTRGSRRQRAPLKLPALAATSQDLHRQTSRARLRYAAH